MINKRFIIRPKLPPVIGALALQNRQFDYENRSNQFSEIMLLNREDTTQTSLRNWLEEAAEVSTAILKDVGRTVLPVTGTTVASMSDEEALRLQQELPEVYVFPDGPIDLIHPTQRGETYKELLDKNDLWHLDIIGLTDARLHGFDKTGKDITIAVFDTGIDENHAELQGKVSKAVTFDVDEWEVHPQRHSQDTHGHGTHVAGLICGNQVGVAPDSRLVSCTIIPKGKGFISDLILAIEWAAAQPEIQIVNISAGIIGFHEQMLLDIQTLLASGVLPVVATGNNGRNQTQSPGNYREPISVGAIDANNKVTGFSSSGRIVAGNHAYNVPDLVAPGDDVYSCEKDGGYEAWDGTSMATPIVSGVAALILEKYPQIRVYDLIEEILTTCEDLKLPQDRQGAGLVKILANP